MMSASICLVLQEEGRHREGSGLWGWPGAEREWTLPCVMAARDAWEVWRVSKEGDAKVG